MKYKGVIQGSRTVDFAFLLGLFGLIQTQLPQLQDMLGKWYGLTYVIVAVIVYLLWYVTNGPLGAKKDDPE